MKIESIQIDGFGKLIDYHWEPEAGFNVIHGPNEAGKSTLLSFIRAMFYGLNDRKLTELKADHRRRFLPWERNSAYGGSLLFAHDGVRYRINRRFGQTKRLDTVQFLREDSGREIALPKQTEPGEYLFSVSEDEFINTVFIAQMQSVMGSSQNIQSKLMQLSSGTGPDISPAEMKQRLVNISREYQKNSDNSRDRILLGRIAEKKAELEQAIRSEEMRLSLRSDIEGIDAELKSYRESLAAVSIALQTEDHLRQKNRWENAIRLQAELQTLKDQLNEQEKLIGSKPWPSRDVMAEAETMVQEWTKTETTLSLLAEQLRQTEADLALYETEAVLKAEQAALGALTKHLQASDKQEQELQEEDAQAKQAFERMLAEQNRHLRQLRHSIEAREKDQEIAASKQASRMSELKRAAEAVARSKADAIKNHKENVERLNKAEDSHKQRSLEHRDGVKSLDDSINDLDHQIAQAAMEVAELVDRANQAQEKIVSHQKRLASIQAVEPKQAKPAPALLILAAIVLILGLAFLILGSDGLKFIGAMLSVSAIVLLAMTLITPRRKQINLKATDQNRADFEAMIETQKDIRLSALNQREQRLHRQAQYKEQRIKLEQKKENSIADLAQNEQELTELGLRLAELRNLSEEELHAPFTAAETAAATDIQVALADYRDEQKNIEEQISQLTQEEDGRRQSVDQLVFQADPAWLEKKINMDREKDALNQALVERDIHDFDHLRGQQERLAERLTQRSGLENRIVDITNANRAADQKRNDQIVSLKHLMGDRIKIESHEAALESIKLLEDKLQVHARLLREADQIAKLEREASGELEFGEVRARLDAIDAWLQDQTDAVASFQEYGAEALRDQTADLYEFQRALLETKGAKQNALKSLESEINLPPDIEREINDLEAEYDELVFQVEAIKKAMELIDRSDEEIRQSFGPLIDQKTKAYLQRLTGESSSQLKVSSSFSVDLAASDSILYEKDYYSDGKVDQIYLALRLAIGESIYDSEAKLPFFYDDILVQYDGQRSERTFDFLVEHSREQGRQIFFITCHDHLCELAKGKYGLLIHELNQELVS